MTSGTHASVIHNRSHLPRIPASSQNHALVCRQIILIYAFSSVNTKHSTSHCVLPCPEGITDHRSFIVRHRCRGRTRTTLVHCVVGICYPDHHSTVFIYPLFPPFQPSIILSMKHLNMLLFSIDLSMTNHLINSLASSAFTALNMHII